MHISVFYGEYLHTYNRDLSLHIIRGLVIKNTRRFEKKKKKYVSRREKIYPIRYQTSEFNSSAGKITIRYNIQGLYFFFFPPE